MSPDKKEYIEFAVLVMKTMDMQANQTKSPSLVSYAGAFSVAVAQEVSIDPKEGFHESALLPSPIFKYYYRNMGN